MKRTPTGAPPSPPRHWAFPEPDPEAVRRLSDLLGIHPLFCRLLVHRGIATYEEARRFFRPSKEHLHDPFGLQDMEAAVEYLHRAVANGDPVLLYGDYDVDGTTSIALMWHFLSKRSSNLYFYIPDRYKEGYGLSERGLAFARAKGCRLVLVMDCGIRALQLARQARSMGQELIILDHHEPADQLPEATAVVDPKRPGSTYPYRELSACALAFKLCQAYVLRYGEREGGELDHLLDLVVTSLACDIVPLTGENRVLAHLGLQRMQNTGRPGLQALWAVSERRPPYSISDIVFGIGPRINAAGRMADADLAVRLLLEDDPDRARKLARELDHRNTIRKEYDQRITAEALDQWASEPDHTDRRTAVLYRKHWHKGLIGIAASRVAEQLHRPTVIFTRSGGNITGSARTAGGLDIYRVLARCDDLLLNWGGHAHAAGLTLRPGCLASFRDRFEGVVQHAVRPHHLRPVIEVEGELTLDAIRPGLIRLLQQFAPFGPGNPNPVFLIRRVKDSGFSRVLKEEHLRFCMRSPGGKGFEAIGFGMGSAYSWLSTRRPADIAFTLQQEWWKGEPRIRLSLKDIRPSEG